MGVVGVEGAPTAVLALHALDPFAAAVDRLAIIGMARVANRAWRRGPSP